MRPIFPTGSAAPQPAWIHAQFGSTQMPGETRQGADVCMVESGVRGSTSQGSG